MLEFTGERVIPGQVEADLWNEHLSRYLFAARLARGKRVADLGCGTGYGSAELARLAHSVVGIDISLDAITWAKDKFRLPNLRFELGPCELLPLPDASVDLAVAYEVIEHLENPEALLSEARRVLAPGGQLVVSTPNVEYYTSSRKAAGPNPFHHREYSFKEFEEILWRYFPEVVIFTQNHVPAIAFQAVGAAAASSPVVCSEPSQAQPESAHFYVAVCAASPQVGSPTFLYLPSTANILAERERHIDRLQELLDQSLNKHAALVEQHRKLNEELEAAGAWAKRLDGELAVKVSHVEALMAEVEHLKERIIELRTALETEHASKNKSMLALEAEKEVLTNRLRLAAESRWVRLGRKLNLGPDLHR